MKRWDATLVGAALAGAVLAVLVGACAQPTQGSDAPQFVKPGETYVCIVPGHGATTVKISQVMQAGWVLGKTFMERGGDKSDLGMPWVNLSQCLYLYKEEKAQ